MNTRENLLEKTLQFFKKCGEITKYLDEDNRNDYIKLMENNVSQLGKFDDKFKYSEQIIDEIKEENIEGNIPGIYKAKMKHYKEIDSSQLHTFVKEFRKKLPVSNNLNDSDVQLSQDLFSQQQSQLVDPITKKPIESPIKNKICGHIYEKSSVTELMKRTKKMKCPYMGCASKNKHFTLKDCEDISTLENLDDIVDIDS